MLSTSLTSQTTSNAKVPINVVLIIDTFLPFSVDETAAKRAKAFLKRTLVRLLIYFQCNMDARFQWTYQFFNSRTHQDIGLIPNRMLQSLTINTIGSCVEEYMKIISADLQSNPSTGKESSSASAPTSKGNIHDGVSPCYNMRQQLVHSLADFGLDISSYQSPMKTASGLSRSQSLQKHFPPVSIRNYMYVISPLPKTWMETVQFLEGKKQSSSGMYINGPRKSDILEVLKGVKEAFFGQGLWDRFLDQHTSLSWIDTSVKNDSDEQIKTSTRISATLLIRSTLELIVKAFGGHIIPQYIFCQPHPPRDAHSFATIFQTYRSLQIHPGLGLKMSKDNWQAIPSTPIGINTEIVRPVNVLWSGDLVCARSSQFVCSVDISDAATSNDEFVTDMDQIESVQVIKRIPSRLLSVNIHTLHIANAMMCFPQSNDEEDCKHATYLIRSLHAKNDALLLKVTFFKDRDEDEDEDEDEDKEAEQSQEPKDTTDPERYQYTRFALLIPTTSSTAVFDVLEDDSIFDFDTPHKHVAHPKSRPFCMAMLEKSFSKLGVYVDKVVDQPKMVSLYRLEETPSGFSSLPPRLPAPSTPTKQRLPSSKSMPGDIVSKSEDRSSNIENAKSIDDPCLGIRKAYLKYLYRDETVSDYVRRLNSASKDITALAAKQGVPLKEAQQKLVTFIIEFLRIWPSKMGSKYKQISKELNIGRATESKSQDNYVILDDERSELDTWKSYTMRSVKDEDVRLSLRKLKTKDTQIQIVQNLQILFLIDKFGLEENKPFKKDPGAHKAISLFMDELCIAASIEDIPSLGLMSPQTPRSKDLDPAKKFFTRVVARFYESTLPKIVTKLAIKCGVETGLLSSPGPSRVSKRAGMKRSTSLGILQKPKQLDLSANMYDEPASSTSSNISLANELKSGSRTGSQSNLDHSTKSVLNSSLFRNRQVVMTRGSVQGVGIPSLPSTLTSETSGRIKTGSGPVRSKSTNAINTVEEEEDGPPTIAKLRLKQFYHDKESEEVLKLFRRQRPLSKADMTQPNPFMVSGSSNSLRDKEDEESDGDLGELGKYLRNGTTSWGVIKSSNKSTDDSDILKSPSRGAAQRRGSPKKKRDTSPLRQYSSSSMPTLALPSLSLPSDSVVLSTPLSGQRYNYQIPSPSGSPSTPSKRAQFRRYQSQQSFFSKIAQLDSENEESVSASPSRRAQMKKDRIFAPQTRGRSESQSNILGSPTKRRRGGATSDDEDDDFDIDSSLRRTPSSPSLGPQRRTQHLLRSPSFSRYLQPDQFFSSERLGGPDRKKVHLESGSSTETPKTVLVPNTPLASILSLDSVLSFKNSTSPSISDNNFLLSTPKSGAFAAAAQLGFTMTKDMYIASPTPARHPTRRNIDFSLFSADD